VRDTARTFVAGVRWALAAVAASLAAMAVVGAAYAALGVEIPATDWLEAIRNRDSAPLKMALFMFLFSLQLLAVTPVAEEFVFRGLLQGWLTRRVRQTTAVAVTALVFAAAHRTIHGFAPLFCVSLCLSAARNRHGLMAAIIAHSFYNAFVVFLALAMNI
jgi:membrane protease YdiL (CAAX protease family)